MADIDKIDEKEVTAPLSVKKPDMPTTPDTVGEDDQTAKIPRPVKPPVKPVVPLAQADDAVPLKKPGAGEEDKTAKIPKLPKASDTKDDKKVVLNSATDSTIRPSDATTMAPAVVPGSIDMRTTESGNVAVVDNIADAPAPAPAVAKPDVGGDLKTPAPVATPAGATKGRKTIKLKPLKKDTPAPEEDNVEETISMDRDSILEGENVPLLAGGSVTKVDEEESLEDESTVKIQKPQMIKPAHPTPVPGSKETIKLRPSTTPPPGAAPAAVTQIESAASDESEETVAVSKKTIRLVPKKPGEDDSTQKTPKQGVAVAPKPSAPTIKLEEPVDDVTQKTARPSASTIKLKEPVDDDVTQKTARPSAPTVKLPEPAAAEPDAAPASSKKTLKLKSAAVPAPTPSDADMPPAAGADVSRSLDDLVPSATKGADPGIIMTLVALLTLIAIAYYAWMAGGQWAEQYMEVKSANVPALSGKVK